MTWKSVVACGYVLALIIAWSGPACAQVTFQQVNTDHISISIDDEPFSDFYIGEKYPKPFLAPLRTAAGIVVTRRYPMETIPGESRDHPHHRGLWIGYGNVNGVNFWENELNIPNTDPETPKRQGRIVLNKLERITPGHKSGQLTALFEWRTPERESLLEERRTMTFYADPELRTIDVHAILTAQRNLDFADTKEGFFAIRVADSMAGKNGGTMINSNAARTEKNVWGRRADWVDYDGTVEGRPVGIAIFDNPENYNHPPRWHSRDYGLFAVNPFGVKDFEPGSKESGGYRLHSGKSMRFRYRVIVHNGGAPQQKIADWYQDYVRSAR